VGEPIPSRFRSPATSQVSVTVGDLAYLVEIVLED
jgi:hypothetical protein